ncbi:DUF993 family protein [Streptomyces sp. JNUCC 64]
MTLWLPAADGTLRPHEPGALSTPGVPSTLGVPYPYGPGAPRACPSSGGAGTPSGPSPEPFVSRVVFAAAHVVADPLAAGCGDGPAAVDWDATLAFRRHLWAHGLGVAEAMDTAQRGAGLDWTAAAGLIRRSAAEARAVGGRIVCGAGTDQLTAPATLAAVRAAYEEQLAVVEETGAGAVLLASRALAAVASGPDDYRALYGELLRQTARPVVLHWLGAVFDPALAGYWGSDDPDAATDVLLDVIAAHPGKVDGVKVSLLDADREVELRRRLPEGVRCYTGDDFHYPELVAGDGRHASDALLGVLDPLAPIAARALRLLDADTAGPAGPADPQAPARPLAPARAGAPTGAGSPAATGSPVAAPDGPAAPDGTAAFRAVLDPTVPLARHLFGAPTRHYKTGVVFLAWLAGHQTHFTMVGGLQSARPLPHLARAYELADGLGLFPDPGRAAHRMRSLLALHGVDR